MELVFNEISFLPFTNNEVILKEQFINMLKLYDKTKEQYGYKHLIFPATTGEIKVTADKTFVQWAYSIPHQGDKNKVLSVPFVRPFANEVLEEKVKELHKYYYTNEEADIKEKDCIGLPTAYFKKKIAISLASHKCWATSKIVFKEIINDNLETKDVSVHNISDEAHLVESSIKDKLMYSGKLELQETELDTEKKKMSLSDDHGKDKLKAFSKKVLKSKYVVSVVNSLPFNPTDINLIRQIYADGKIELVLYWENAGYGIVIQTTGRNYRETEAIAEILKKKFDK